MSKAPNLNPMNDVLAKEIQEKYGKTAKELMRERYGADYMKFADLTWEEMFIGCSTCLRGPDPERDE